MNKKTLSLSILLALSAAACSPDKSAETASQSPQVETSEQSEAASLSVSNPQGGAALPQLLSFPASDFSDADAVTKKVADFPSEWVKNAQGEDVLNVLVTLEPGEKAPIALVDNAPEAPDVAYAELSVRNGGEWNGSKYEAEGFSFENVRTIYVTKVRVGRMT